MKITKSLKRFTLENKPSEYVTARKKTTIDLVVVDEPFEVETQEGVLEIGPETVDDWEGGYYVAYPDDGSKPYPINPQFVRDNYEAV
jgi:hypothetical protein